MADPQERLLADEVIERWKGLRDQALADSSWRSELARERVLRAEVGPKILSLMRGFLDGAVSLVEFQSTLDRKSRTEWNILGIKGSSGAMFLNMLVKHIPNEADLVSSL